MEDATSKPLETLAAEFERRGFRAKLSKDTLVASLGVRGKRVIVCDGRWFRWNTERGHILGEVGGEAASVERVTRLLRHAPRWP